MRLQGDRRHISHSKSGASPTVATDGNALDYVLLKFSNPSKEEMFRLMLFHRTCSLVVCVLLVSAAAEALDTLQRGEAHSFAAAACALAAVVRAMLRLANQQHAYILWTNLLTACALGSMAAAFLVQPGRSLPEYVRRSSLLQWRYSALICVLGHAQAAPFGHRVGRLLLGSVALMVEESTVFPNDELWAHVAWVLTCAVGYARRPSRTQDSGGAPGALVAFQARWI